MLGPILIIKLKSSLCPCFTSQEDNGAIAAANFLSNVTIIYHSNETSRSASESIKGVGKLVSGFFKNASQKSNGNGNENSHANMNKNRKSSLSSSFPSSSCKMTIVDSLRGPALSIEYIDEDANLENNPMTANESDGDESENSGTSIIKKNKKITLKRIGEISSTESFMSMSSPCGISIFSKPKTKNEGKEELCRLDLKDHYGNNASPELFNETIDSLKLLLQWDMDRRAKLLADNNNNNNNDSNSPEEDDDYDDDEINITPKRQGLGQRALKMKHFAEREIELSKQKKDRESRKARYLKDSGGLKYTALAMANRQMS